MPASTIPHPPPLSMSALDLALEHKEATKEALDAAEYGLEDANESADSCETEAEAQRNIANAKRELAKAKTADKAAAAAVAAAKAGPSASARAASPDAALDNAPAEEVAAPAAGALGPVEAMSIRVMEAKKAIVAAEKGLKAAAAMVLTTTREYKTERFELKDSIENMKRVNLHLSRGNTMDASYVKTLEECIPLAEARVVAAKAAKIAAELAVPMAEALLKASQEEELNAKAAEWDAKEARSVARWQLRYDAARSARELQRNLARQASDAARMEMLCKDTPPTARFLFERCQNNTTETILGAVFREELEVWALKNGIRAGVGLSEKEVTTDFVEFGVDLERRASARNYKITWQTVRATLAKVFPKAFPLEPPSKLGAWLASHYTSTGAASDAIGSTVLRGAYMADTGDNMNATAFGREMKAIHGDKPDKKKKAPMGIVYLGLRRIVV